MALPSKMSRASIANRRKRTHSPDDDDTTYQAGMTLDLCTADFDSYQKQRKLQDDLDVGPTTSHEDVDVKLPSDVKPTSKEEFFRTKKSEYLKRSRLEAGTSDTMNYNKEVQHCMTLVSDSLLDFGLNIGDWHAELKKVTEPTTGKTLITPHYCHVCQVSLSGQKPMDDHKKGKPHLKKLLNQEFHALKLAEHVAMDSSSSVGTSSDDVVSTHDDYFKCKVCDMDISGKAQRLQHINGKKHRKKVADRDAASTYPSNATTDCGRILFQPGISQPGTSRDTGRFSAMMARSSQKSSTDIILLQDDHYRCQLCVVDISGEYQRGQHLNGQKHQKKLAESLSMAVNAASEERPTHYCETCNVYLNGEQPIRDHLSGIKHNRKLKRQSMDI